MLFQLCNGASLPRYFWPQAGESGCGATTFRPCRILGLAGLHILKQSIFSALQSAEFLRSGDNIIKINRSHFHRMNQNIHSHKA